MAACLVLCLTTLVLLVLAVSVSLYLVRLNKQLQTLEEKVEALEAQNCQTEPSAQSEASISSLFSTELAEIKESTNLSFAELQASVHDLSTRADTIDNSTRKLKEIRTATNQSLAQMKASIRDLHYSVDVLANSTRQRFAGCLEERHSCSIGPVQEDIYYRGCHTPLTPPTIPVSIIHTYIHT